MSPQAAVPLGEVRRILVIRRNRMGDMICTLPVLRALRATFPEATLDVACDDLGVAIAEACEAVNTVIGLKKGINRLHTVLRNRHRLRGYDIVIAVKAGFDRSLASMVRQSGARHRIGFAGDEGSHYYNHPVPLPPFNEHQIESCLRLLQPLGIQDSPVDLHIQPPGDAMAFAEDLAIEHALSGRFFTVFNLSSNRESTWPQENLAELGDLILQNTGGVLGLSCLPKDRPMAIEFSRRLKSPGFFVFHPPTPMALAAVFQHTQLLVTAEGGAAHLAAATDTPAIVLWPLHGTLDKWHSCSPLHQHIRSTGSLADLSVAEVWAIVRQNLPGAEKP